MVKMWFFFVFLFNSKFIVGEELEENKLEIFSVKICNFENNMFF